MKTKRILVTVETELTDNQILRNGATLYLCEPEGICHIATEFEIQKEAVEEPDPEEPDLEARVASLEAMSRATLAHSRIMATPMGSRFSDVTRRRINDGAIGLERVLAHLEGTTFSLGDEAKVTIRDGVAALQGFALEMVPALKLADLPLNGQTHKRGDPVQFSVLSVLPQ